ncbi:urea ABC transporter ATP-binding subunit UrtE [Desulfofundulus salinus]|uniref:Urea ABC transporter ATP-binding subunit UrtE n=1 Tax=Desulfofundulus salinus TaxID=2419843 RepID=A0A494WZ20_9FIRM|nr:urea ABC transporter ATP-binding subunit UrtE [Desulfofundulus salinum]RKO66105.1 urea ABC transporter ATP-binding subunit UrtE [Desulfofundulus salinum]
MLNVERLTVSYGESIVLKDIQLQVPDGAIVALIGRNGVGKTTLLKSIMGLLHIKEGKVILAGEDITTYSTDERARRGIGYVPQGRDIFPYLTVYENLVVGLDKRQSFMLEEVLNLFPMLKGLLSRMGGNLSGGQQQQLAIARALVREPRVLLFDEPTEGIQPSVVIEIERVIKSINKEKGVSVLLVEQYLDFALRIADYLYVMEKGQIVLQGETREIKSQSLKEYLVI